MCLFSVRRWTHPILVGDAYLLRVCTLRNLIGHSVLVILEAPRCGRQLHLQASGVGLRHVVSWGHTPHSMAELFSFLSLSLGPDTFTTYVTV